MRALLASLLVFALAGCVTAGVDQKPAQPIDFSHFQTVAFAVRTDQSTEIADGQAGRDYASNTVELFRSMLEKKIRDWHYTIVSDPSQADLQIDVYVSEVKPGSAAARILIGFGAGRAATVFEARFLSHGKLLASFHGGRSYTGAELTTSPFSGADELSALAATRCVQQIETFMAYKGSFPSQSTTASR